MDANVNSINWFEISVSDINRAKKFYETVFDVKLQSMEMMDTKMEMFPWEAGSGKVNGALAQSQMHTPGTNGVKIYMNGEPDLSKALNKVEAAGGKVTMPKTAIGENGFMAFFMDTEGNSIGLHSNK